MVIFVSASIATESSIKIYYFYQIIITVLLQKEAHHNFPDKILNNPDTFSNNPDKFLNNPDTF